jgi:FAD/FMN-containing dehydrogenase
LKIIGQYRVPFGIKGGGHSLNPGFSSTTGIQISMTRLRKIIYHSDNQTVDIGSGLLWNDVYAALDPQNITVIGGRFASVGVAGLILGGGYSWKSNQYGLSIDNVFEYEVKKLDHPLKFIKYLQLK